MSINFLNRFADVDALQWPRISHLLVIYLRTPLAFAYACYICILTLQFVLRNDTENTHLVRAPLALLAARLHTYTHTGSAKPIGGAQMFCKLIDIWQIANLCKSDRAAAFERLKAAFFLCYRRGANHECIIHTATECIGFEFDANANSDCGLRGTESATSKGRRCFRCAAHTLAVLQLCDLDAHFEVVVVRGVSHRKDCSD